MLFKSKAKKDKDRRTEGGSDLGRETVIHAMPRRFVASGSSAGKARGTGIMILLTGVVILAVAGVLVYFYVMNPDKPNNTESGRDQAAGEESGQAAENAGGTGAAPDPAAYTGDSIAETPDIYGNDGEGAGAGDFPEPEDYYDDYYDDDGEEAHDAGPSDDNGIIVWEEENGATGTPEEAASTTPAAAYKAAIDSDGDGLSDAEEAILGSDRNAFDSDGDGYGDLVEAMNLYNPGGEGGLLANDNIERYVNGDYGYRLLYPRVWIAEMIGGGDSVIFTAGNGQFMQVIIQPNPGKQPVEEWYKEQLGVDFIRSEQVIYKSGWLGIRSEDGLIAYLAKPGGDKIFVLSYSPGSEGILSYSNIFAVMIKSLETGDF